MTWFGWWLAFMQLLALVVAVSWNDKRRPLTPQTLAYYAATQALLVLGIFIVGTGSL